MRAMSNEGQKYPLLRQLLGDKITENKVSEKNETVRKSTLSKTRFTKVSLGAEIENENDK